MNLPIGSCLWVLRLVCLESHLRKFEGSKAQRFLRRLRKLSLYVGPTACEVTFTVEEFVLVKRTLSKRVLDRARLTPE